MEKRGKDRITKRLEVKFHTDVENTAITSNLSESGIFIRTKRAIRPGSILDIKLNLPNPSALLLKGKVVRCMSSVSGPAGETKSGIGVQLISPPPEYISYINSLHN